MGHASGFYIKETRIKAIYISLYPMPNDIKALDWDFEEEGSWSKLLSFHMGSEISPSLSLNHLEMTLEKCLQNAFLNPYSILVRVAIANQMVSSTF